MINAYLTGCDEITDLFIINYEHLQSNNELYWILNVYIQLFIIGHARNEMLYLVGCRISGGMGHVFDGVSDFSHEEICVCVFYN